MSTRRFGFLSPLRRWWPVVAVATGAGGFLGYAYASSVTPAYEAEAKLVVGAPALTIAEQRAAGELVPTYAELVKTRQLLEPTLRRLGLPLSAQQLEGDVRGEAGEETRVLTVRVRDEDAERAVRLANGLAAELIRFVARGGSSARAAPANTPDVRLRVVERASRAGRVRPQMALTMELAALAGLFGALAVAVLVELRGRRVRDERDLAGAGFTVLGSVDAGALARSGLVRPGRRTARPTGDSYDLLAARISAGGNGDAPRSLLVLGTQPGDGSAAVALNIGLALAAAGTRVAVADVGRRSQIARLAARRGLHAPIGKRIGTVRQGAATLDRFRLGQGSELVLAVPRSLEAGRTSRERAEELVRVLLEDADFVVVHAASLRRSPDALAWARAVEATVVVARRDRTSPDNLASALDSLEQVRTNVLGTVFHTS
jgi:capsular polysaccharide biosynthesis protein/Mrp family chromosome partitioning ATPase